jgi:cobalt-zinc-cadmium efflux system membrane fusion protein
VKLGDRVTRGQPLVSLRSPGAASARADEAKAIAELNSRETAVNFARHARERAERLLELKAIAVQEVERARNEEQLAEAARSQAQTEVDRARAPLREYGTGSGSDVVLRAPAAGVVVGRDAVAGSVVEPGHCSSPSPMPRPLAGDRGDRVAAALKRAQRVEFTVPAYGDEN